jgi:outer membrane protein OmpA-like peptidoglycan-associated protein
MKFSAGAVSLLALALFVLPVSAQDSQPAPDQPAAEQAAPAPVLPDEVLALIGDTRAPTELSVDELKARAKAARGFAKDENLPQDIRGQLKAMAEAARAEIDARQQAAEPAPKAEEPPAAAAEAPAAQPEQPAAPVAEAPAAPAAQPIPEAVQALLSDNRALPDLSEDDLKARAKSARRFAKDDNLPDDVRGQLKAMADAARAELEARQQAAQPAPQPEQPAAEAPAAQPEQPAAPVAEAPAAPAEAPAAQPLPEAVQALLSDNRPLTDLSVEELQARAKSARRFAQDDNLSQNVRDQLSAVSKAARAEALTRDQQNQQAAPAPEPKSIEPPPAVAQEAPAAPAPEAPAVAQEAQPAAPAAEPPPAVAQEAPAVPAPEAPVAVQDAPPPAAAPAPAAADVKALDSNAGDPASEKQAQAYLAEATPLENLSDEQLRTRLDDIRNLMSANELSRDTERAVRKKLKGERDVLRQRLAVAEATAQAKQAEAAPPPPPPAPDANIVAAALPPVPVQPPAPPPPPAAAGSNNTVTNNTVNNTVNNTTIITNVTPVQVVLQDRRPPEELQVVELQRRVQVYNDAQFDDDYDDTNRAYWRAAVARDREILRRRMIAERHRREAELALNASDGNLDIEINIDFSPSRPPPPRDVFAAEVDDEELEEILVAPPRRKIKQRYNSVEEIAVQPKLRDSVSRIEIDTIRFGTNQAFVREEQLSSLDGIAAIVERIVRKYPNEVFMIEGHTDAVGSDAANNRLSKLRAEAVKKALVSYYVIPARNLRTVGLGERFLKIPTADAEPENRRVSISRVTQLLSEADNSEE